MHGRSGGSEVTRAIRFPTHRTQARCFRPDSATDLRRVCLACPVASCGKTASDNHHWGSLGSPPARETQKRPRLAHPGACSPRRRGRQVVDVWKASLAEGGGREVWVPSAQGAATLWAFSGHTAIPEPITVLRRIPSEHWQSLDFSNGTPPASRGWNWEGDGPQRNRQRAERGGKDARQEAEGAEPAHLPRPVSPGHSARPPKDKGTHCPSSPR